MALLLALIIAATALNGLLAGLSFDGALVAGAPLADGHAFLR
jgi:hypothetical protein